MHFALTAHRQACWHLWNGTFYEVVSDDDIKARLWRWLATCLHWSKPSDKGKRVLQTYRPQRSFVTSVLDALKAVTNHSSTADPPCWLETGDFPDPANVIAFANGLLDVEAYLSGSATLLDHTPNWFSTNCLPHGFDSKATCPRWLEFLEQVFDGDGERIACLRQWFGYNLTTDNRQHKSAPRQTDAQTAASSGPNRFMACRSE